MEQFVVPILWIVGLVLFGWLGIRSWKMQRLVANLPTSKVDGITLGLTELVGECVQDRWQLESPFSKQPCVTYRFHVEERQRRTRTGRDAKGRTYTETYHVWVTLFSGSDMVPFFLKDDTGRVHVLPNGSDWDGVCRYDESLRYGHPLYDQSYARCRGQARKRRFREWTIAEGDPLYILAGAAADEETGLPYIRKDEEANRFLISVKPESRVRSGYLWQAVGASFLAIGLLFGALAFGGSRLWPPPRPESVVSTPALIAAGAVCVIVFLFVWIVLVFNDLVWLRTQIRKAVANQDVELKKRADLVPNLVRVVRGYVGHESATLEEVTAARSLRPGGSRVVALGETANEQTRQLGRILALAEDYPSLKADALFGDLMQRLTAIENRISLLRTFHNETVLNYHNRIETFPTLLWARAFGFRRRDVFMIDEFEAKPIEVSFAEPGAVRAAGDEHKEIEDSSPPEEPAGGPPSEPET